MLATSPPAPPQGLIQTIPAHRFRVLPQAPQIDDLARMMQQITTAVELPSITAEAGWQPVALTLREDVLLNAHRVMQRLIELRQHGAVFTLHIDLMDGREGTLARWTLLQCQYQHVKPSRLDYGSNETVSLTITLHYTEARFSVGDV